MINDDSQSDRVRYVSCTILRHGYKTAAYVRSGWSVERAANLLENGCIAYRRFWSGQRSWGISRLFG